MRSITRYNAQSRSVFCDGLLCARDFFLHKTIVGPNAHKRSFVRIFHLESREKCFHTSHLCSFYTRFEVTRQHAGFMRVLRMSYAVSTAYRQFTTVRGI